MRFFKINFYRFFTFINQLFISYIIFLKNCFYFKLAKKTKLTKKLHNKNYKNRTNGKFRFKIVNWTNYNRVHLQNWFFFYNLNIQVVFELYNRFTSISWTTLFKKTFGEGYYAIRIIFFIFLVDALITDDEPLWEPIEWSLAQTWLLFIFGFAWIAENLITSRFGSYTGRDKRVWLAWYKSFWLIELIYVLSYGSAAMFVIVPFYYELTYNLTFIFSWWTWYTKIFFFKFLSIYSLILVIANYFLLNIKWLNWKINLFLIFLILLFLSFLLYSQFIITFFAYFTDPLWYQKTRSIDYVQLSHEPLKWGWGPAKRDHFTYHKASTVFWFKNDSPFAGAFLMFNFFFFLCLFFLLFYWLILFRRTYAIKEVSFTLSTFCVSALKQFFFFFLLLFVLIFISFIMSYWRFPIEFFWLKNSNIWFFHFLTVFRDYAYFLIKLFF